MRGQHHIEGARPAFLITFLGDAAKGREPGIVDENVEPAEPRLDFLDDTDDARRVRDIERPAMRLAALGLDFGDHRIDALLPEIEHRDLRALGGKDMRGRPPHAARRARDERHLALDRAAEFPDRFHELRLPVSISLAERLAKEAAGKRAPPHSSVKAILSLTW